MVMLHVSHGQECGTAGVELLSGALRDQPDSFLDSLDLVLKWVSLRLCEKENVKAMGQVRVTDRRVSRCSTSNSLLHGVKATSKVRSAHSSEKELACT